MMDKLLTRYHALKQVVADVKRHHAAEAKAAANVRYAHQEQQLALKQFPGMSIGQALAAFHKTDAGMRVLKASLAESYAETQLDNALGNTGEVSKVRNTARPDSSAERAAKCAETIKALMAKGLTYDQAASKAHQQERDEAALATADSEADQQRLNSGSWRNPQHEYLNPVAADGDATLPTGLGNRSR
jgi:hypothetical protein